MALVSGSVNFNITPALTENLPVATQLVLLVTLLIPVWAIFFNATIRQGTLAFWETITLAQWVGMGLIALGLAVLNKWIPLPGSRR